MSLPASVSAAPGSGRVDRGHTVVPPEPLHHRAGDKVALFWRSDRGGGCIRSRCRTASPPDNRSAISSARASPWQGASRTALQALMKLQPTRRLLGAPHGTFELGLYVPVIQVPGGVQMPSPHVARSVLHKATTSGTTCAAGGVHSSTCDVRQQSKLPSSSSMSPSGKILAHIIGREVAVRPQLRRRHDLSGDVRRQVQMRALIKLWLRLWLGRCGGGWCRALALALWWLVRALARAAGGGWCRALARALRWWLVSGSGSGAAVVVGAGSGSGAVVVGAGSGSGAVVVGAGSGSGAVVVGAVLVVVTSSWSGWHPLAPSGCSPSGHGSRRHSGDGRLGDGLKPTLLAPARALLAPARAQRRHLVSTASTGLSSATNRCCRRRVETVIVSDDPQPSRR